MKLANDRMMIIPFEPTYHAPHVYRWFHSGNYESFFGNIPLMTTTASSSLQNAFMIVDPNDANNILGMAILTNIQERHRNLQYHLLIDRKYQANGIGVDATKFMLHYILKEMNMYLVEALICNNEYAERCAIDCGFEFESNRKQRIYQG